MSQPVLECVIEHDPWTEIEGLSDRAMDVVQHALVRIDRSVEGAAIVLFTHDEAVQTLNRTYRGKNKPTNVLSFPAPEREGYPGDIALGYETCLQEADNGGLALKDHATHLVLHGFLHLLGYDHQSDEDAALMEGLETKVLKELGLRDPYEAR